MQISYNGSLGIGVIEDNDNNETVIKQTYTDLRE